MCAASLGFGGVETQAQRCDLWPHADKTGVSKGVPFGTRLCKAKCSVLYLLAWLTGETGVSCMDTPVSSVRKADRFLRTEVNKNPVRFQRAAAGIFALGSLTISKLSSLPHVPSRPLSTRKVEWRGLASRTT